MIVAGLGFSSNCPAAELVSLVRRAEEIAQLRVQRLAVPAWKMGTACLLAATETLLLPVDAISKSDFSAAATFCVTRSAASQAVAGVGSAAEAAALAAAGPSAHLLLSRIASEHATCALAQGCRE